MKQIIVMVAILPLLLIFVMQIGQSQIISSELNAIEYYCEQAENEATVNGYFPEDTIDTLKTQIAQKIKTEPANITVTYTGISDIKYRMIDYDSTNLISYSVQFILPNIMAGNRAFGIRDEDNVSNIVINRSFPSEKLAP